MDATGWIVLGVVVVVVLLVIWLARTDRSGGAETALCALGEVLEAVLLVVTSFFD